jgi:hypothetical protein
MYTLTGMKIVLTSTPGVNGLDALLKSVYELYCDYVLKNPFHDLDMPVRSERFVVHLGRLFSNFNTHGGNRKR